MLALVLPSLQTLPELEDRPLLAPDSLLAPLSSGNFLETPLAVATPARSEAKVRVQVRELLLSLQRTQIAAAESFGSQAQTLGPEGEMSSDYSLKDDGLDGGK
jgi:hypothetical protein